MRRFLSKALAYLICAAALAVGGVVRIETNGTSHGQGWMFLDVDGRCKIVTPAHVVRVGNTFASIITITDAKGYQFTPSRASYVLSEELDVALLLVNGADNPSTCGDGRLSTLGVSRRVASMTAAIVETTGMKEIVSVPVRRRASLVDKDEGSKFTVQPTVVGDRIVKGWSGSVVLDEEGLLGLVVEVDGELNEAIVIRADVIRRLVDSSQLQHRPTQDAPGVSNASIILLTGEANPQSNSVEVLGSDGPGWTVMPSDHRVAFVVVFESQISIKQASLRFTSLGKNVVEGMDVAVGEIPTGGEWASLKYCRIQASSGFISCGVLGSTVRNIRISLKTTSNDPIALFALTIN